MVTAHSTEQRIIRGGLSSHGMHLEPVGAVSLRADLINRANIRDAVSRSLRDFTAPQHLENSWPIVP